MDSERLNRSAWQHCFRSSTLLIIRFHFVQIRTEFAQWMSAYRPDNIANIDDFSGIISHNEGLVLLQHNASMTTL